MNVYDSFFENISPESWEFFAIDFLSSLGFMILQYPSRGADGGLDSLVALNGKKYLVSCKHYIISGSSVGVNDEQSILDRITQHDASGFIGFYSTVVSTALSSRFSALTQKGYESIVYDKNIISDYLPKMPSCVLQKYGLPNQIKYVMNVSEYSYKALNCLKCGLDILHEDNISSSMALVCLNDSDKLEYLYGCKRCIGNIPELGWVEVNQSLHQEQLNGWIDFVNNYLQQKETSSTFYKHKSEYESGIQQRMYPSNWGLWPSIT